MRVRRSSTAFFFTHFFPFFHYFLGGRFSFLGDLMISILSFVNFADDLSSIFFLERKLNFWSWSFGCEVA